MVRRPQWTVVLLALLLGPACYRTNTPAELTDGVWAGTVKRWQLAVEFRGSHLGTHAVLHILRDGRKLSPRPADLVRYDPPRLEIWCPDGVGVRGRIDLDALRIEGQVEGVTREPIPITLERVDPVEVPGLLARPGRGPDGASYAWSRPPETGDGWSTATPGEVDLTRALLESSVSTLLAGDAGDVHSLLLVRRGKLVLEEYFHGYDREDLHPVASVTKSVVSMLVGIAIDRGRIESVPVPLLDSFPELRDDAAAGWEQVTLEHVLTMMTGRRVRREPQFDSGTAGDTLFAELFATRLADEPGTHWDYNDRNVNLLAGVLAQATGGQVEEFAQSALFEPLGIEHHVWARLGAGVHPRMHTGLGLRPRDMGKVGQLVLDGGRWGDHRVVSESWVKSATATRIRIGGADPDYYGYLWWHSPLPERAGGGPVIFASGWGSQFIFVVPDLETVVVITGGNDFNYKTFLPARVLQASLLPAFG